MILRLIHAVNRHPESSWFLFLLAPLLFFGDGIQPVVDLAVIIVVFGLLYVFYAHGRHWKQLPPAVGAAMPAILAWGLVAIPSSYDAGFTVSAVVRTAVLFLAFRIFYSLSDAPFIHSFAMGLGIFSLFAEASAILLAALFGQCPLPSMNLLCPIYGHSHVVDILLLTFPYFVIMAKRGPHPRLYTFMALAVSVGIIGSYSRAAILISALFAAVSLFVDPGVRAKRGFVGWGLLLIFLSASVVAVTAQVRPAPFGLFRLVQKPAGQPLESRMLYWSQAIDAIRSRPLTGGGPGTFSLLSKEFQREPNRFSWFAHNSVLQTAAEWGLVGTALWAVLIVFVLSGPVYAIVNRTNGDATALAWGIVLFSAYSLVDFNTGFIVPMLLFWASAGLVTGYVREGKTGPFPRTVVICSVLAGLYYLLSFGSYTALAVSRSVRTASFIAPVRADLVTDVFEHTQAPLAGDDWLLAWHRNNPSVYFARAHGLADSDATGSALAYQTAFRTDPLNISEREKVMTLLSDRRMWKALADALADETEAFLPPDQSLPVASALRERACSPSGNPVHRTVFDANSFRMYLAKMLYEFGYGCRITDPESAGLLWGLARDTNPDLSYYAVELSRLYAAGNEFERAKATLEQCRTSPYAKKHCSMELEYYKTGQPVTAPGTLEEAIRLF